MIWILTYTACLLDAWLNAWLEQHWKIVHWINAVYRLVLGAAMLYFFPMAWYLVALYIVGAFCGYWQAFNILYNFLRVPRKPLLYVGSGPRAAVLDQLEHEHQAEVIIMRAILAIGCLLIFSKLA